MDSPVDDPRTEPLRGVLAAVLTPMTRDLDVDRAALSTHCQRLLDAGCHALGLFGTTGEANSLSVDERLESLEAVVADGIPPHALLPGTGACALPDAVRLTRGALELGVRDVLVLPPFYYKDVSDDGLFRFFAELLERVGDDRLQLFLYNFVRMAGVGFSLALIERLVGAFPSAVAGTKDSDGDPARIERVCREFPQLAVFTGAEDLLLDTLQMGRRRVYLGDLQRHGPTRARRLRPACGRRRSAGRAKAATTHASSRCVRSATAHPHAQGHDARARRPRRLAVPAPASGTAGRRCRGAAGVRALASRQSRQLARLRSGAVVS